MAVTTSMFLFEVVVSNVRSMVENRNLIIRSDFADIFSLELKDPKQMNITMPEPLPLPPEPPGKKKGKKKPKPKKGKKGKKGAIELPPPEPVIQSGQSVLFTCSAEILIQNMKKCPMELSLWSKEDYLLYIGGNQIPWDPKFLVFLQEICNCKEPSPVTVEDEYNIFDEETAKLMIKLGIQVKLSNLTDKVTTSFRTLSEDPYSRRYLYTGINSKTTSFMCTLKTTDEDYERNMKKIPTNYVKENASPKIVYATYKNAPSANLSSLSDADYCCQGNPDTPPENTYKSPETCPDIDFIIDYVRKIIISCNDNMRMLTPRPTIKPRIKATDIDKFCYCREKHWPEGELAERFKEHVQAGPCPICVMSGKEKTDHIKTVFDIANLRGPCGQPDCKIARRLRQYIENLVNEDQQEIELANIIGPCGSKNCTLAEKILEFIRHEGIFSQGPRTQTVLGLTTQCDCLNTMQRALMEKKNICENVCELRCEDSEGENNCPFDQKSDEQNNEVQVYNVYYCMVKYDFEKEFFESSSSQKTTNTSQMCPSTLSSFKNMCSKSTCSSFAKKSHPESKIDEIFDMTCNDKNTFPPSPADSSVVIRMEDILNPCCVKSCDLAERVKTFIADNIDLKPQKTKVNKDNPCYCDCECTFQFSRRTTYCPVCGGYECLGDDMRDQPSHIKPHPCPVYHRLYDKRYIQTPNIWPEQPEDAAKLVPLRKSKQSDSVKGMKPKSSAGTTVASKSQPMPEKKPEKTRVSDEKKNKKEKKKAAKTDSVDKTTTAVTTANRKSKKSEFIYPAVPRYMGWNWKAEDIPGMKPRPKWKPGGCNKLLVRRYRALREGVDVIAKKKRALMQRKKKTEMRPTLVIKKQKGEYTVQMEVFKKYSKERLVHQFPYEEKPPVVYTIGKTEEEIRKRQRQKERKERRETRRKSRLLQSTFRDKCQEICLKAYNQAIGLLPLPNPNDPNCPCQTDPAPNYVSPSFESCSCSEDGIISTSDTDEDDWIIEFTPPAARWDPKAKHPPHTTVNESQYSYLDYKVKLNDKLGNPVPRYFKGPDGKEQCSDLGGFWGPDKVWLEINKDGYVGPDNRWVPTNFTGPDGMYYSSDEGYIIDGKGQTLKIGIDGYIDQDGKWAWYPKKRTSSIKVNIPDNKSNKLKPSVKDKSDVKGQTQATAPKVEKRGMTKMSTVNEIKQEPVTAKEKVKLHVPSPGRGKCPLVMSVSVKQDSTKFPTTSPPTPTKRNNFVDPKKLMKYKEIMQGLQMYEDLQELKVESKPPIKTNRASNTTRNMSLPLTAHLQKHHPLTAVRSFGNNSSTLSSEIRT